MSEPTVPDDQQPELPCHVSDPDLWFADSPSDLERAKALCADCPIRGECLAAALARAEPWGVWGGEILAEQDELVTAEARGGVGGTNELLEPSGHLHEKTIA